MSRLQVGGLALIIRSKKPENLGVVVRLIDRCFCGGYEGFKTKGAHTGNFSPDGWLMPLGDKQTQDELAKEKELEYTR